MIFIRRMKIGNTFNISASAIAQHPTNIPPRIPNTAANIFPPGMDMWNTQKIFASIPPSATLSS
jgi:hypothetical protein